MDPVTQTLAQQQSGSAEGQGFGQFYLQGKQLGQEQQRINLSKQRLDLERVQEARAKRHDDLIDPLHANLLGAQATSMGAEAYINVTKAANYAYANAHLAEIFELENTYLKSPKGFLDPEGYAAMSQLSAKDSRLFAEGTPGAQLRTRVYGAIMQQQDLANKLPMLAKANEQLAKSGLYLRGFNTSGPEFGVRPDTSLQLQRLAIQKKNVELGILRAKNTGNQELMRQLVIMRDNIDKGYLMEGMPDVQANIDALTNLGISDPTGSASVQAAPQPSGAPAQAGAPTPEPSVAQPQAPTGPDVLAPSIRAPSSDGAGLPGYEPMAPLATDIGNAPMGPLASDPTATLTPTPTTTASTNRVAPSVTRVQRPPTTAGTTKMQEESRGADMSLRQLVDLRGQIDSHPEAFGIRGAMNKWKEVLAGTIDPKADATVTRIRQKAGQTFVSIAKSLRPDVGNMSKFELDRLMELGDLTTLESVPSVAAAKSDELITMQVAKKLRIARDLKEPISDMVLKAIEPADVVDLLDDQLLTEADMLRTINLMPKAKAEAALRATHAKRDREAAERAR